MVSDKIINYAFRIHKTLFKQQKKKHFFLHYLLKLYFGFNHVAYHSFSLQMGDYLFDSICSSLNFTQEVCL